MNETFTNVVGDAAVLERVVDCWASLFGERVIAYRASQGLTDEPAIAVVVQRMVDSERAGVMFTADPSTGDRDRIVIEAAFGLGEVVVCGQVEPDTYVVAKDGPRLLDPCGSVARPTSSSAAPTAPSHASSSTPAEADGRVLTDDEAGGAGPARAARSRRTTAAAPGHRVGDRRRARRTSCSRGRSPPSARPAWLPTARLGERSAAAARPRRVARLGERRGAGPRVARGRPPRS